MQRTEIVINNALSTGTCFGVTFGNPPQAVFVPGKVAAAVKACVGDRFSALLVPNSVAPDRTPWMAAHLEPTLSLDLPLPVPAKPAPSPQPMEGQVVPQASIPARVRATLLDGGVWSVGTMFAQLFPNATRADDLPKYNAVSNALRTMFDNDECSKFQMWRMSGQTKPGREWYTCRPDLVDLVQREG